MTNLYLTEQGTYLRKRGEVLIYEKEGEGLLERPLKDVGMVVVFGNVQVSVQALLAMLESGCDVSLMTRKGHFRGRVASALGKNSPLRVSQHRLSNDSQYRLNLSRRIVAAKIFNGIRLLKSYHYSGSNPARLTFIDSLEKLEEKACRACSLEELRGCEGAAARRYFEGFRHALTAEVGFPGRRYYPSTDPLNAVLSFGYSFVARELQGLLEAFGLDPYVGFYHVIEYGRASLSIDLLEEYRHCLVDRLTLRLFNKKILNAKDFEKGKEDKGFYLKRDALKVFIKHYEQVVNDPSIPFRGSLCPYRYIFREQAAALRKAISENSEYTPFRIEK